MRSWFMNAEGGGSRLELRDVAMPKPGPGQLLLKVRAAGLNRGEFIIGHGLTQAGTAKALGIEAAGEVVEGGSDRFAPGRRVMARIPGGMSEYVVVNEAEALHVPEALSWQQAAAIPTTYMVAHDMIVLQGQLPKNGWVLVTGASSGVSVAAMQIAKALGGKVIGTSGSQDKLQRLQALGLDVPICTRQPDFHQAVMDATGGAGVNVVVNAVGGSVFAECVRCLAYEGRLATVGYVDNQLKAEIDLQALHARRLVLFGVSNKMVGAAQKAEATAAFAEEILPHIAAGRIAPVLDQVFPFEQLPAARERMEANAHLGKIVISL